MDLWRVIVFAIVKQCLDLDHDDLLYRANNDLLLRELLGHGEATFDAVKYSRQRLVDNVQLLTPELVLKVTQLIVRKGHKVAGKKFGAALVLCPINKRRILMTSPSMSEVYASRKKTCALSSV